VDRGAGTQNNANPEVEIQRAEAFCAGSNFERRSRAAQRAASARGHRVDACATGRAPRTRQPSGTQSWLNLWGRRAPLSKDDVLEVTAPDGSRLVERVKCVHCTGRIDKSCTGVQADGDAQRLGNFLFGRAVADGRLDMDCYAAVTA